ncbi:HAD family hydrolase [Rubrolithibacter danxiaensis]|uniref:HAD family hydrolase n=1 Tax=Rubrolithibacter danxiaensis TaxID=3390805 RepID=UPI003BF837D7
METSLKNRFDSIIFDLDGTLWDSTVSVAEAWQAAKDKVGYIEEEITPEAVAGIAGMPYDAIYDKLFPALSQEKRNEFKEICAKKELEVLAEKGGILYPELEKTLAYLSEKYRLFIVSNCQTGYIEVFLKLHQLEQYFEGHQCYGTKNMPKAENIKDIVKDHDLKASVYIGDTMGDYESSKKAGVPFIFAAYGFGKVNEDQVASLEKFEDLTIIL